jgi:transcriptional regulator with XRE-family HTH domain
MFHMNEAIRQQIKSVLAGKGLTQKELAQRSGVREDYISKMLRGERVKTPKEFSAILEVLGLELCVKQRGQP